jgi:hypothetical protein
MKRFQPLLLGLALLLLALPGAVMAKPHRSPGPKKGGHYVGKSSQGLPVSLRVDRRGSVVAADLDERIDCEGGYLEDSLSFETRLRKHRTFKEAGPESDDLPDDPDVGSGDLTGDYVDSASGRFYGARKRVYRRVKGKFHTRLTIRDGSGGAVHECDSGTVTFTAKLAKR